MYGQIYFAHFSGQAETTAFDLWELLAPADMCLALHMITFSQSTEAGDAEAEMLNVVFKRATGSFTSGSGGSSPTLTPKNQGQVAASATLEANNTTIAVVGSGTLTEFWTEAFNVQAGYQHLPIPENRFILSPSTALIVTMSSTPADSVTFNATIVWEEIGG